uniref:MFS transporter n=1 Tax=Streptomyces niveiscabiei TaxID=164115 RepID=UPI00131E7D81
MSSVSSPPSVSSVPSEAPASSAPQALLLPLLALCTAVTAANIYLAIPLLPLIARDFGTSASSVAWIAAVAQFGYATGLLAFAPLGDRVNRQRIVGVLSLVTAVALGGGALAGSAGVLGVAVFLASAATIPVNSPATTAATCRARRSAGARSATNGTSNCGTTVAADARN